MSASSSLNHARCAAWCRPRPDTRYGTYLFDDTLAEEASEEEEGAELSAAEPAAVVRRTNTGTIVYHLHGRKQRYVCGCTRVRRCELHVSGARGGAS